ncbi:MAG TPA: NAD(P)/FAD-dependent oxidoreductase [Bryobacteraceae bacterium]|nr:NAD(P)/FAD-dependent oxidoreductase [Bryobacteraceae bacterium]
MALSEKTSATVIGAGPNGLTAAIELAAAGLEVTVHEDNDLIGGGARTAELTLPGFLHDVCSAVHPLAVSSPCFENYPLANYGLEWIQPDAPLAHPLDDGTAVILERSLDATCTKLGPDGEAWRRLFEPLVEAWPKLRHDVLGPPFRFPSAPVTLARFGLEAIRPARALAESRFRDARARALFGGIAAHSALPLEARLSAGIGLVLATAAHAIGWPIPKGGAQRITNALAGHLRSLGGQIRTRSRVETLPESGITICDVTPRQLLPLAAERLPAGYRNMLAGYRYGPGVFKLDWALKAPIPWAAVECRRAATVHVGGTLEEIAAWESRLEGKPFVLLTQPTLFDPSRAPQARHTAWAYCHVRNGSAADLTDAIEEQVERFAPGFRSRILQRHVLTAPALEYHNMNLVGGDINGGAMDFRQFLLRSTRLRYRTPAKSVYLCSSSTPPGGGVHGMCGYHAARAALGDA